MIKKILLFSKKYWWFYLLLIVISWLIYVFFNCKSWPNENCTGFLGKTIWDVLELLIIPVTLAGVAAFLDKLERKADREIAQKRFDLDLSVALDNQRESALQEYFDIITGFIKEGRLNISDELFDEALDDDIKANKKANIIKIANVRTRTVLRILDTERKNILVRFLADLKLIWSYETHSPLNFDDADLQQVRFKGEMLQHCRGYRADFSNAFFDHTNMNYVMFGASCFKGVQIVGSNLEEADLFHSNFQNAMIFSCDFKKADLREANFQEATLTDVNFFSAKLIDSNFYKADLTNVNFEGAIMPDGNIYDPEIHNIDSLINIKINAAE